MEVAQKPKWPNNSILKKYDDEALSRIVMFYVFYSPGSKTTYLARKIKEYYEWSNPWRSPYQLDKQLQNGNEITIKHSDNLDKLDNNLKEIGLKKFPISELSSYREIICVYKPKSSNCAIFDEVFRHIRNSLAHGRFLIYPIDDKDFIFELEDVQKDSTDNKYKVSARMLIKKSTLIRWIDIIEGGEKKYHKSQRKSFKKTEKIRREKK